MFTMEIFLVLSPVVSEQTMYTEVEHASSLSDTIFLNAQANLKPILFKVNLTRNDRGKMVGYAG